MEQIDPAEIEIGKPVGRSAVRWQPRLGLLASPLRPAFGWFFRHRHKRLRRHFGDTQATAMPR